MTKEHRRFVPNPNGTQQMVRPALRQEVMRVLHDRPDRARDRFIEVRDVEQALQPGDFGVWPTLQALAEYGLVEAFPAMNHRPSRVLLTHLGQRWTEPPPDCPHLWEEDPTCYVFQAYGQLRTGFLSDWAKVWQDGQHSGDIVVSDVLLTWENRNPGYAVMVDRLSPLRTENGRIDYRVWAAGEQVTVRIDGRT